MEVIFNFRFPEQNHVINAGNHFAGNDNQKLKINFCLIFKKNV